MLIINGEIGGGQILRTSLSLSIITGKPFKIINIRKNRENPGLQHQHLTAVDSAKEICDAELKGNVLHSTELEFSPGNIQAGNYTFNIGTAGSTTLVLQTILPALLFAKNPSTIEITGGTENPMAPPSYDFQHLFLSQLFKLGIIIRQDIIKHGYYPKGGGKIKLYINPIKDINKIGNISLMETSEIEKIDVHVESSMQLKNAKVGERILKGFQENFKIKEINNGLYNNITVHEHLLYHESLSPGCFIHAHIHYKNGAKPGITILGERNKKAELLGKEAAIKLAALIENKIPVDEHTADQLLIYMALKPNSIIKTNKITEHIKTNIEIIEKFLNVKFNIKENLIECNNEKKFN